MYKFRNKEGKEITLSQEEIDLYVEYVPDKYGTRYRDVSYITIPSDKDINEGYYLIEYNGYQLKE